MLAALKDSIRGVSSASTNHSIEKRRGKKFNRQTPSKPEKSSTTPTKHWKQSVANGWGVGQKSWFQRGKPFPRGRWAEGPAVSWPTSMLSPFELSPHQ
jgi:hypothetical protein